MEVRDATPADGVAVRNVIDGAALELGVRDLDAAILAGDASVAVESGRVLGALVLDGEEIVAVAVRRRRRDQGIGRALVATAREKRDRLFATFDPGVLPFWERVGFEVTGRTDVGRYRARSSHS
ncbi:MAG: GNAT family N-acetyltransferase [Halovenus sp.]